MLPGETILSGGNSSEKDPHVSEFQVMHSGGGYYVGTIYTYCGKCKSCEKEGVVGQTFEEPNSRETDYFRSREDAEAALATFQEHNAMPVDRQAESV